MISKNEVFFNIAVNSKAEALQKIADCVFKAGVVTDKNIYYKALLKREEEITTGFGQGIAIPHAKIKEVLKAAVFYFRFAEGVEWKALDGQKVKVAIALAVPEQQAGTTHLELISKIARKLMHSNFRHVILTSEDADEVVNVFKSV